MIFLNSDNASGMHPEILKALGTENNKFGIPYGGDETTEEAISLIRNLFEDEEADVLFVTNGTAANVVALGAMVRQFETVICTASAHINMDEAGAFERLTSSKLTLVPDVDGKLTIDNIKLGLKGLTSVHQPFPKVVSISTVSETGSVYTVAEIKEIVNFAHENKMMVHVDGARLANALVATGTTAKEYIKDTGVDILAFGGTKNGMMIGEAIVNFNRELSYALPSVRKQSMQLMSKTRFISAMFIPYIKDNLYITNAESANGQMKKIYENVVNLPNVKVKNSVDANIMFIEMDDEALKRLKEIAIFNVMNPVGNYSRLVTSFNTTDEEVDRVIAAIKV